MANDRHIDAGVGDVTVDEFAFIGFASRPEVPPVSCTFFAMRSLYCSEHWVGVPSLRLLISFFLVAPSRTWVLGGVG